MTEVFFYYARQLLQHIIFLKSRAKRYKIEADVLMWWACNRKTCNRIFNFLRLYAGLNLFIHQNCLKAEIQIFVSSLYSKPETKRLESKRLIVRDILPDYNFTRAAVLPLAYKLVTKFANFKLCQEKQIISTRQYANSS